MSSSSSPISSMFVYGTLKQGQCRQSAWPVRPLSVTECWVEGNLLGRHDYPAMVAGGQRVLGECWSFESSQVSAILETLDRIEGTRGNGPGDLYHRHIVQAQCVRSGQQIAVYAYFYNRDPAADGFVEVPVTDGFQSWPG